MFNYFWKMRYVWAVAHISLIYSLFQAPQYFFYGLLWGAFATMIGSYAGWHRYWAHRSYKTDTIRKNIMTWMGILGCTGKPITVIGGHRIHHKHSDTEMIYIVQEIEVGGKYYLVFIKKKICHLVQEK